MNIKDDRKNKVQFKELQIGDVFEFVYDMMCMKIPDVAYRDGGFKDNETDAPYGRLIDCKNAVRLSDGELLFIYSDEQVNLLEVTLDIE